MRIAIATCEQMPAEFTDDVEVEAALQARGAEASTEPWTDASVDWDCFDAVVIRSTWDYAQRREEFLAWVDSVGERLHNSPAVVRWNSDKRYLADLAAAGLPTIETAFVAPSAQMPELEGEVVVKPSVSAGGRDTGRFGRDHHDKARALIAAIHSSGRVAIVQPYAGSVDTAGETAVVFVGGEVSHALRKGQVLRPDEVAPVREGGLGAAEVMYDPDLVRAAEAAADELALASRVVSHLRDRFDGEPLYARVDMVRDSIGRPMVMELEAIEPSLYLGEHDGAVDRLAEAIVARVSG